MTAKELKEKLNKYPCQMCLSFVNTKGGIKAHCCGLGAHIIRVKLGQKTNGKNWGRMICCEKAFNKAKKRQWFIRDETSLRLLEEWVKEVE